MLHRWGKPSRFCDGVGRREFLRIGSLGCLGLPLSRLLAAEQHPEPALPLPFGKARSCIVLWMGGGPPQHETFDPKPSAPAEIRGELGAIPSRLPGVLVGELMPRLGAMLDRLCVLRAVSSNLYAHSASGYWMLTGYEHPLGNIEVANKFSPFDHPCLGAVVKSLTPSTPGLPAAVTIPEPIMNNPRDLWPGQDGGFLGAVHDPWLVTCDPSANDFQVPGLSPKPGFPPMRLDGRRRLLEQLEGLARRGEPTASQHPHDTFYHQALDLVAGPAARQAIDLAREPAAVRDRYGRHKFGQSCLLARRLVEAGVRLVQVNWPREKGDTQVNNPVWDTHFKNAERLKTALMPPMDQGCSALIQDLEQRGRLDDTLIVWMGEFGRSPRINREGGRDHWGAVYSVMLAGAGVKQGLVYGASDKIGAQPLDGKIAPHDLTATIYYLLGIPPSTEIRDSLGRPYAVSRGTVVHPILA